MNVSRLDGTRVVSDVPLPDVPIGRDGGFMVVVDPGAAGRQTSSTTQTVVEIAIPRVP